LERPAIKEDGILVYSTAAFNEFTVLFESKKNSLNSKNLYQHQELQAECLNF